MELRRDIPANSGAGDIFAVYFAVFAAGNNSDMDINIQAIYQNRKWPLEVIRELKR